MNYDTIDNTSHNDEEPLVSSSRSGVASGTLPSGATGCEDNVINTTSQLRLGQPLRIGTWNCGGLSFTIKEMCRDLEYDALVLTETHDKGSLSSSKHFITADKAPDNDPYAGVAILLSDKLAKCVRHTGCLGSRIVYAEVSAVPCNLFLIGVYLPHSSRKQAPYFHDTMGQLSRLLDKVSSHTSVILLGDFNCKLGRNVENVTGKWCIHKKPNGNGIKLMDMMRTFNLSAVSTLFQPKRFKVSPSKSSATYLPKESIYKPSQIDYILVSSRWATATNNCKVKWGMTCQRWGRHYDHGLVSCTFKSRTRKRKKEPEPDYSTLQTDADLQSAFDQAVSENLAQKEYDSCDPTQSYSALVGAISEAAAATLSEKRSKPLRKRQVSNETRELYRMRKNNFEKLSVEERKQTQHKIVKSIRNDYLAYVDSILVEMEKAESVGNSREITKLRKQLSGKPSKSTMPSKDKNGEPIASEAQLLDCWNDFLREKFAKPPSDEHQPVEHTVPAEDVLEISELEEALKSLRSGKAPGLDGIPIEAFKSSVTAKEELFRLCHLIWQSEQVPEKLVTGIFIMLYKKGCRDDFGNYRAICLLCHAYKILSAVLARRLHLQLADILPDSQAGFRPARGTRDNVCILKWTVNMILREDKEAVITFIDYKAAFDTESQRYLDNALSSAGVSVKVRRLIQSIFRMASGCIRIGSSTSDSFDISRGVLQGDIFSPVAFIAGLWRIFTTHDCPDAGVTVGSPPNDVKIRALEYADDAGLLDNDTSESSIRLTSIARGSREEASMVISEKKTKAMHVHRKVGVSTTTEEEIAALNFQHKCPDCQRPFPTKKGMLIHLKVHCGKGKKLSRKGSLADKVAQHAKRKEAEKDRQHVALEGRQIENVYDFIYLGCKSQADGDCMADVRHRMVIAQTAFNELSSLWSDHRLPLSLKFRLYRLAVCSTLTHGCEAWELTLKVRRTLNGFNCRCLNRITSKPYRDTAKSPDFDLILAIRKRRLRYLGHILRMSVDRLVRRTFIAYVSTPGGPPDGSLLDDCRIKDLQQLTVLAQDRRTWRALANNLV